MPMSEKIIKATIILAVAVGLFSTVCRAQDRKIIRQGDTFSYESRATTRRDTTITAYTFKDGKGKTYPICMTAKGRAYVGKTSSKTGKYYRYYLDKQIEEQIIKENL